MKTEKLCVLWDHWTPKVTNRILIDLLTLKRYFRVKGVDFQVAASPELKPFLDTLGLTYSPDFGTATFCRVYVYQGDSVSEDLSSRIPPDIDHGICYLDPKGNIKPPGLIVNEQDPYGGFPLPYPGKSIPPTMQPRYYRPKTIVEPVFAPFI